MRPIRQSLVLLVTAGVLSACDAKPKEYGVYVFSVDTVQSAFTTDLEGSLALSLRSEGTSMLPDKSLLLTTPAQLAWVRGDGKARIKVIRGNGIAVQPFGFPPDSADTTTVEGRVVVVTRPVDKRVFTLAAETKKTAPDSAPSKSKTK